MDGAFAAVVGALIGAPTAYWLSRQRRRREDIAKREATTSAVLAELSSLSDLFDELTRWRSGTRAVVAFPTTAHERLVQYLEFLEPPTTYAILGVVAVINDVRRLTQRLDDESGADERALRVSIETRARAGLRSVAVARDALLAEAAEIPPTSQPSGDDEVAVPSNRVRFVRAPQAESVFAD